MSSENQLEPLLEVKHLKKYFPIGRHQTLRAVDDVTFTIYRGETLGIVGESGCGKTTCGRTCIGLYEATAGSVTYEGNNIHQLNRKDKKQFTKEVQMIFQDPYASLDPRLRVKKMIEEGMKIHNMYSSEKEMEDRVYELLDKVGLNREHANRYIHEFSGGQRQRVGIARALALSPKFILCDEPISALDVSVQAQIINLLVNLQREQSLTYLFIAHDLAMVRHISDRVGVMYLETMVELATTEELYNHPAHPYTQALLSAIPIPDPRASRKQLALSGDVPSPIGMTAGCRFQNRCPRAISICSQEMPEFREIRTGHSVACHLFQQS